MSYRSQSRSFVPNRPWYQSQVCRYPATAYDSYLEAGTVCGVMVAGSVVAIMSMKLQA